LAGDCSDQPHPSVLDPLYDDVLNEWYCANTVANINWSLCTVAGDCSDQSHPSVFDRPYGDVLNEQHYAPQDLDPIYGANMDKFKPVIFSLEKTFTSKSFVA
jgi:hypothetical protein